MLTDTNAPPASLVDHILETVGRAMREVARTVILPSFHNLTAAEIGVKGHGSVVTRVDRESEERLGAVLRDLIPGSTVVGEEAVSTDPTLLDCIGTGWTWLLDPLDGTTNFVAGVPPFAVMIALLHDGEARASWLLDPIADVMCMASIWTAPGPREDAGHRPADAGGEPLRGVALTRYYEAKLRAQVEARFGRLGAVSGGSRCVGAEYMALIAGRQDFTLFWNSQPWDHAAGVFQLRRLGGRVAYLNGDPFKEGAKRFGLLAARSPQIWERVRDALIDGIDDPDDRLALRMRASASG